MYYYQFNIGDYSKSTLHLSPHEDIAYRRLLDIAYDSEKPLPPDIDKIIRLIRMKEFKTETQQVLSEFFTLTKKGYIQKRVKKELDKYSLKARTSRLNGKLGGRPKKTQWVTGGLAEITQSKAKQEPLNKNQEPIVIKKSKPKEIRRFTPPTLDEVIDYFVNQESTTEQANTFFDHFLTNGWKVGGKTKTPMKDWKAAIRNWIRRGSGNGQRNNQHRESIAERSARQTREIFAQCEAEEARDRLVEQNGTIIQGEVDIG